MFREGGRVKDDPKDLRLLTGWNKVAKRLHMSGRSIWLLPRAYRGLVTTIELMAILMWISGTLKYMYEEKPTLKNY